MNTDDIFERAVCSLGAPTIIGDYLQYQIKLKDGTSFLAYTATVNYLLVTIRRDYYGHAVRSR